MKFIIAAFGLSLAWLFSLVFFKKDYFVNLAILPVALFSALFIFPYGPGVYYIVFTFIFWLLFSPKHEINIESKEAVDLGGKIIVAILISLLFISAIIGLLNNYSTCLLEIIGLTGLLAFPMTLSALKRKGGSEVYLQVLKVLFILASMLAVSNLLTLLLGGKNYALRYSYNIFKGNDYSDGWRWGTFSDDTVVLATFGYFMALSLLSQVKVKSQKTVMYLIMLVSLAGILATFSITMTVALGVATLFCILLSGRLAMKTVLIFLILIFCFYVLFSIIPLPGELAGKLEYLYENVFRAKIDLRVDPTSGRMDIWKEALSEIDLLKPKGLGYVLAESGRYNYHNTILNYAVKAGPLFAFFLLLLLFRQFSPTRLRIKTLNDNPFIKGAYLYFVFYFFNEMGTSYFSHSTSSFLITFLATGVYYFLNNHSKVLGDQSLSSDSSVPRKAGAIGEIKVEQDYMI